MLHHWESLSGLAIYMTLDFAQPSRTPYTHHSGGACTDERHMVQRCTLWANSMTARSPTHPPTPTHPNQAVYLSVKNRLDHTFASAPSSHVVTEAENDIVCVLLWMPSPAATAARGGDTSTVSGHIEVSESALSGVPCLQGMRITAGEGLRLLTGKGTAPPTLQGSPGDDAARLTGRCAPPPPAGCYGRARPGFQVS